MRAWIAQKNEQNNNEKKQVYKLRQRYMWWERKWQSSEKYNEPNKKNKQNQALRCIKATQTQLELSKNAAWGKTRVSWCLLEAPEKTGPVQSHDCSIAIAEGFLNSVVRSWGPPVTLCCTDSIWEGVKMRGLLLPTVLQIFTTTQQLPLYCPPTGAFGLTVFVHFLAVASC